MQLIHAGLLLGRAAQQQPRPCCCWRCAALWITIALLLPSLSSHGWPTDPGLQHRHPEPAHWRLEDILPAQDPSAGQVGGRGRAVLQIGVGGAVFSALVAASLWPVCGPLAAASSHCAPCQPVLPRCPPLRSWKREKGDPFFSFFWMSDDFIAARGRSGGIAVWARTTPQWELEKGVV